MNCNLFVAKLSYDTKESTLQDLFAQAGKVVSVRIIQEKPSGQSKGFGFIEMGSLEEAAKAIELFNGKDVDGRMKRGFIHRTGGGMDGEFYSPTTSGRGYVIENDIDKLNIPVIPRKQFRRG